MWHAVAHVIMFYVCVHVCWSASGVGSVCSQVFVCDWRRRVEPVRALSGRRSVLRHGVYRPVPLYLYAPQPWFVPCTILATFCLFGWLHTALGASASSVLVVWFGCFCRSSRIDLTFRTYAVFFRSCFLEEPVSRGGCRGKATLNSSCRQQELTGFALPRHAC